MAASSAKDKAQLLKDSYVAGLIDGGAADTAPVMPTQDMGEQASVYADIHSGFYKETNDGNPTVNVNGPQGMKSLHSPGAAYPLRGKPGGASQMDNLITGPAPDAGTLGVLRDGYYNGLYR